MAERQTALETGSLTIRGARAHLRLENGVVTIARDGDTVTAPSEVTFEVAHIRGASRASPPRRGRGWLHIAVVGGSPAPPSELAAVKDPYTLPLSSRGAAAAKRFERMVEKHIKARGKPADPGTRPGAPNSRSSHSTGVSVVGPPQDPPPLEAPLPPAARRGPSDPAASSGNGGGAARDRAAEGDARAGGPTLVSALRDLADLHAAGALTDAEFQAAKAKLLG